MKEELVKKAYEIAKERYAKVGVDTDRAIELLEKQQISLHCWQTDDVIGFESADGLSGGIQTTGNYPGRARNIDEVRKDLEFVKTLLAGNHRVNLHEIYGDFGGRFVDRDQVEPKHFESWMQWAKEQGFKLDFNSTSFGHPKSGDLSLSNPDPAIRTAAERTVAKLIDGALDENPYDIVREFTDGDDLTVAVGQARLLFEARDDCLRSCH